MSPDTHTPSSSVLLLSVAVSSLWMLLIINAASTMVGILTLTGGTTKSGTKGQSKKQETKGAKLKYTTHYTHEFLHFVMEKYC